MFSFRLEMSKLSHFLEEKKQQKFKKRERERERGGVEEW